MISWRSSVCIHIVSCTLLISSFLFQSMSALDVPVFYRTPFFQGQPAASVDDWTIYLKAHYAQGSTRKAWNAHSKRGSLFSSHGFFDIGKLGLNQDNLTSLPLTNDWWGVGMPFADGPAIPVEFTGKFRLQEFDLTWRQNLFSGFFAQMSLPFKDLKLSDIGFINRGDLVVNGINVDDFLNNQLDPILGENGLAPVKTPFKKSSIDDLVITAGWEGQTETNVSFIDRLSGQLQAGILVPLAGKRDTGRVFALPVGHDQFLGALGRGNLEVGLWKYLRLGASVGAVIFFVEERFERVNTDLNQNGWILLEKTKVKKDQGTMWDFQLYGEVYRLLGGLSALAGFSYTTQERTILSVRDSQFLKEYIDAQLAAGATSSTPPFPRVISQNNIVNANKQLEMWEQFTLHFLVEYDARAHFDSSFAPKLSVAYDYSIYGRRAWLTDMWGGSLELQIQFDF